MSRYHSITAAVGQFVLYSPETKPSFSPFIVDNQATWPHQWLIGEVLWVGEEVSHPAYRGYPLVVKVEDLFNYPRSIDMRQIRAAGATRSEMETRKSELSERIAAKFEAFRAAGMAAFGALHHIYAEAGYNE